MLPRGGMSSTMNLGSGSMPQEKEFQFPGNWMPATPQKPVPAKSNPIPVNRYGNHTAAMNWQELPALPSGYALGTRNYNGAVQNFNMVDQASRVGSYYHSGTDLDDTTVLVNQFEGICNETIGWDGNLVHNLLAPNNAAPTLSINRTPSRNTGMVSTSLKTNLDPQATNWSELLSNQGQCSFLSLLSNDDSLQHTPPPSYECPVPYRPLYNLNSPPRPETDASSSIGNSIQFTPETPDQVKRFENHQLLAALNFSADDSSNQEKENQHNLVTSIGNEATQLKSDALLQNILESSVVNSTLLQEQDNTEKEIDPLELNKTPQQKPPKRKKHRPKVVVEGKPKRTPKSATPRNTKSKEIPTVKRKYVRKKGLKESARIQHTDVLRETTDPSAGNATRACKRTLNFDPEKRRDEEQDQIEIHQVMQQKKRPFNLNSDFNNTELFSGTTNGCKKMSAVQVGQPSGLPVENHVTQAISRYTSSLKHVTADHVSLPEKAAESKQAPWQNLQQDLRDNLNRNLSAGNVESCQNSSKMQNSPIQQTTYPERVVHRDFQVRNNHERLDRIGQLSQCTSYPTSTFPSNNTGTRGSKRGYHVTEQMHGFTLNRGSSLCQQIIQMNECIRTTSNRVTDCSEAQKKKKIENGLHKNTWGTLFHTAVVEDCLRQAVTNSVIASPGNHETYIPHKSDADFNKGNFEFSISTGDRYAHSKPYRCDGVKQPISCEPHAVTERIREINGLAQVHSPSSNEKCNLIPPTPPRKAPAPVDRQLLCVGQTLGKQSLGPTASNSVPCKSSRLQRGQNEPLHDYQENSGKTEGPPEKEEFPVMMEKIINGLEYLDLSDDRGKQITGQEQNALVLYKTDGSVVPYEGYDFIKKRKQRPKVDLDQETTRIWNLLMGKKGSEADEGLDKEKEKWWEEERRIFRGRADSFIARMHLVQGDRRFSQWKGSVVDSVIGVFLTQNVSDHLSSSAFMSLAAQFPLNSGCHVTHALDAPNVFVEADVCVLDPNDTITWQEKIVNHPPDRQSTSSGSHLGIERTSIVEIYRQSPEEVLSSPDSFDSSIVQPYGGIRSCSGSNSDAEHPITGSKETNVPGSRKCSQGAISFDEFFTQVNGSPLFHRGTLHGHMQIDVENNQQDPRPKRIENFKSSTFTQPAYFNNSELQMPATPSKFQLDVISQPQVIEIDSSEMASEEQTCSFPAIASGLEKGKDANDLYRSIRQTTNVKKLAKDNNIPRYQDVSEVDSWTLLRKENTLQPGSCTTYEQLCDGHQHPMKTFQPQETPVVKLVNPPEIFERSQSSTMKHMVNAPELTERIAADEGINLVNKQKFLDNKLVESNSPVKAYDEKSTSVSRAKKGKAEIDKNNAIEWDNLRRQVQANGRRKERSTDTMDSLDYEAIRQADVTEISTAIRDRGMNNMLAERIKEFLNRIVRDHGSTDLEWLRDVPPDKAKDYLLSIRGLGLKSVECVRLLTLRHLAFPVDTNVGRIAVRLGWVPLQPLPESLHIHLLELYPILESVQKYLWPRLCKLDQRTLYELHYQLITFGKVFCTKNKPNCNACPMRGECRHFASAFASARLALPGPEEKSITSATVPIIPEARPFMITNLMQLPPPEKNSPTAWRADGKCEPIIEEPATPEQEFSDVLDSDIEDFFWEDPDEIPTIKLNVEAFSANVQHYMQENMELQEADMSKALVALNPVAASIPTAKLKNVSRLRTEHQVYELPDSHPLLKEMERREPDDPSPYLLAIWRPGETADSIQPPEQRCESQEKGQLCDKETCFPCNSIKEANLQTVRGTLLIPCRTATRGSFPLNGTYFQVNEVFADHASSLKPINVPREWLWNLPRRMVYFGTSVTSIFRGLSTEGIQYCFWKGFVCVRGFEQKTRAPRPLVTRLHYKGSKLVKTKNEKNK